MSFSEEYFDSMFEKPKATLWQISSIEQLLHKSALDSKARDSIQSRISDLDLTEEEAEEIITKLLEGYVETDPQKQWKNMAKAGVFNESINIEEMMHDAENRTQEDEEDEEERSECCGARMDADQRLCYECKDHC